MARPESDPVLDGRVEALRADAPRIKLEPVFEPAESAKKSLSVFAPCR